MYYRLKADQVAKDILSDANAAELNARNDMNTIKNIVTHLTNGISAMEALAVDQPEYYLDQLKADNAKDLEAAEKALASAETEMEKAKYQLEQYENGYANLANPYSYEVEYLKTKVDNAKDLVEFAKAHYEELQAKYDAANK